jgi:ATP-dependent helicase/nuclease subunit B
VITVQVVSFGKNASEQLAKCIAEAKQLDPLTSVTVLVPSNYASVSIRRQLAAGQHGPTYKLGAGVIAVDFLTPFHLAERLASAALTSRGRKPVSNAIVAASVRNALANQPGMFAGVTQHSATERALVNVHRELRDLDSDQLDKLAASNIRTFEIVKLHRLITASLCQEWYDEFDLLTTASHLVNNDEADLDGEIIVFLPQELGALAAGLVKSLGSRSKVSVLIGMTGVHNADRDARRTCALLEVKLPNTSTTPPFAQHIISTTDPDDETRFAARTVLAQLDQGISPDRIAVVYPHEEPYRRLLHERFDLTGIRWNGSSSRRLSESVIGKFTLGLLSISDQQFRRDDVLDLLSSAPIRLNPDSSELIPDVAWARRARAAGVVAGIHNWTTALASHRDEALKRSERLRNRDPENPKVEENLTAGNEANALHQFILELSDQANFEKLVPGWRSACIWLQQLLDRYIGPYDIIQLPEPELRSAELINGILSRLRDLENIETSVTRDVFRRTLELELDQTTTRVGTMGDGVFVGKINQTLGFDFDYVHVLGMAEGVFPTNQGTEGLLADQQRQLLGEALPMRSQDLHKDHRNFLSCLATAPYRSLSFPRGDLRRNGERHPSRWVIDSALKLGNSNLDLAFTEDSEDWAEFIPSFISGIQNSKFPATANEHNLAELLSLKQETGDVADHNLELLSPFEKGRQLMMARESSQFTRFDGNLSGVITPEGVRVDIISATRLEAWAKCPHSYFLRHILGVTETTHPETELRITALDRGSLVHEAADLFLQELINQNSPSLTHHNFSDSEFTRMRQIGSQVAQDLEDKGLTGRPVFWPRDREAILNDLRKLLKNDTKRQHIGTIIASEFRFGEGHPIHRLLPSGKKVSFRGSADRVEQKPDGNLIVIDYKTGKPKDFKGLSEQDPTQRGTKLQLPIYGLAAREMFPNPQTTTHVSYWFTSEAKGEWKEIGYEITDTVLEKFDAVIESIVIGIESGVFPARPANVASYGEFIDCAYCDPDGYGTGDLQKQWEVKSSAIELADYLQLAEGSDD